MRAVNLHTEYLVNPMGIDIRRPRLSWNCEGGEKQTAYRVTALSDDGELLWDSGKVLSSRMHLIPWQGEMPGSRKRVLWSVTLWDENGEKGEESGQASFEMGLLEREDWQAEWIRGDYSVSKKKRYPADTFRKSFTIPDGKKIVKARAYMTACGVYEGRLNGRRIGSFVMAPGITDYRKRIQYQTVDITALLQPGENQLIFMLADGWYRGGVGAYGNCYYYGTCTKLLAQFEISYADGSTETFRTDGSWESTQDGPIRFADNKDGEIVDAAREDYRGAEWKRVKVERAFVLPSASDNVLLTEHEVFTDPRVITSPSGKKILDFGQNIAGYFAFCLKAEAGKKLLVRGGEKLDGAGEFTQANIQCSTKKGKTPLQQVIYSAKEGENDYQCRFTLMGFQYLEVTGDMIDGLSDEALSKAFRAIAVYSDLERTFHFSSSNELLNRFVESTFWSLRNNSADLPTDCPTRERHGWTGDAQLFCNTASYMTNYMSFARKYENDLCDWQREDGCFPQIAPYGGVDFYMNTMNGSVGWSDAGVYIPYRMFRKYGDIDILKKYYRNMKAFARFTMGRIGSPSLMARHTGLRGSDRKFLYNAGQHYGEWAEPKELHPSTVKDFLSCDTEVATGYAVYLMHVMGEIAAVLNQADPDQELRADIAEYKKYEDGCRKAYQVLCDRPQYTLDTNRQARLVRPLYFDLLSDEQKQYAKERLIKALDEFGWRVGTGFLSTPLILYVLTEIDPEYAYHLLENEKKPGWLFMPKSGATTIWEDWDGPDSDHGVGGGIGSLNHYSKGAVCEWVFDTMCGISVAGENRFRIAPVPGGHFTCASLTYDSVYGRVSVKWEKRGGEYHYQIEVPANAAAELTLADGRKALLAAGIYEL